MKIASSTQEARTKGWTRYQGRPCLYGHIGIRMANGRHCVDCLKERKELWVERNLVQAREIMYTSKNKRKREQPTLFRTLRKVHSNIRRGRQYGAAGCYTKEDLHKLLEQQGLSCHCGVSFLVVDPTIDHKTPLSRGGSNWPRNLQLLCQPCNGSKGTKTQREWLG